MVSYFKTQWFRFAIGLLFFIFALVYLFQPAGDPNTLEGLQQDFKNEVNTLSWFLSSILWFTISFIDWNKDNIKKLRSRIDELEQKAITDIDEVGPNHFVAKRRCGPDKDVPYLEE